jgi:hypothetical protein
MLTEKEKLVGRCERPVMGCRIDRITHTNKHLQLDPK